MHRPFRPLLVALAASLTAVLAVAAASPAAAAPAFAPATTSPTGSCPGDATGADFDRDGVPDVVVTQTCGAGLGFLRGSGDGTFRPVVELPLDDNASGVAVGDFDRDGKPDVAASIHFGGRVAILRGNGDGTFDAAVEHDAGPAATDVAVGDLDGDGRDDLIVSSGTFVVSLRGNGDGTFAAPVAVDTGSGAAAVALGDVDRDGRLDVVVAQPAADRVVVLRAGAGAPTRHATSGNPVDVVLADVDGDGALDAATANWEGSCPSWDEFCDADVSVLPGDGAGAFGPAQNFPARIGPQAIAAGDVDLDGRQDLVVVNRGSDEVSVFSGGLAGFGAPSTLPAGGGMPTGLAIADLDGDLRADLVSANYGPDEVATLLNLTAAAPRVVTGAATELTPTGARLTATLNPTGVATTYRFEYGTSDRYDRATGDLDGGSGGAARPVGVRLEGLSPATTYRFRVVATNALGTSSGAGGTFTTPAAKGEPPVDPPRPQVTPAASPAPVPSRSRVAPRGLSVRIAPTPDRRPPIRYRLHGRLLLSPGTAARDARAACGGQVRLTLRYGRRVVAVRHARVGSGCGWSRGIWLDRADGLDANGRGRLRLTVRFVGNAVLTPLLLAPRTVTFGR